MERNLKLIKTKLDNILLEILRRRKYAKKHEILCFNFHQVAKKFNSKFHSEGTFTSLSKFEKIIKYLKKNYEIIGIKEAIYRNKNKFFENPAACITFDDGDKSIIDAIDFLASENFTASFYLNSSYILKEKINLFYSFNYLISSKIINQSEANNFKKMLSILRYTKNFQEYNYVKNSLENYVVKYIKILPDFFVSYEYLKKIDNNLFSFGLHGYEHDRFINLSKFDQIKSLEKNIKDLVQLPQYINVFAIPFGRDYDWNSDTIDVCNTLGIDYLFANGGCNIGDSVGLRRIPADNRNIILEAKLGYYQTK